MLNSHGYVLNVHSFTQKNVSFVSSSYVCLELRSNGPILAQSRIRWCILPAERSLLQVQNCRWMEWGVSKTRNTSFPIRKLCFIGSEGKPLLSPFIPGCEWLGACTCTLVQVTRANIPEQVAVSQHDTLRARSHKKSGSALTLILWNASTIIALSLRDRSWSWRSIAAQC